MEPPVVTAELRKLARGIVAQVLVKDRMARCPEDMDAIVEDVARDIAAEAERFAADAVSDTVDVANLFTAAQLETARKAEQKRIAAWIASDAFCDCGDPACLVDRSSVVAAIEDGFADA